MRDYGAIYSQFWTDPAMQSCTPSARLLACYLLTGPHTTMLGAFRLPFGYIYDDLGDGFGTVAEPFGNGFGTVSERFTELFRIGFATYCGSTKWVLIHKFLKWNPPQNPNQVTAVLKLFGQVPETCCFYSELYDLVDSVRERFGNSSGQSVEPLRNGSETVAKPYRNQKQNQEQDQDQKQKKTGAVETPRSSRARACIRAREEPEAQERKIEPVASTEATQTAGVNGFEREKAPAISKNLSPEETLVQKRERIRLQLAAVGVPSERLPN